MSRLNQLSSRSAIHMTTPAIPNISENGFEFDFVQGLVEEEGNQDGMLSLSPTAANADTVLKGGRNICRNWKRQQQHHGRFS